MINTKLPNVLHYYDRKPTREYMFVECGKPTHSLRKSVNNAILRTRLAEAQNWRCAYCGIKCTDEREIGHSATIEHIVPRSIGGRDVWENMVMACKNCNSNRSSVPLEDFLNSKYLRNRKLSA